MSDVWDYCPYTVSLDALCDKYGVGVKNPSHRVLLAEGGDATVAALFTDWDKGNPLFLESKGEGNHAEMRLLRSDKWLREIPAHLERLADSSISRPIEFGIVINRTPCKGGCATELADQLRTLLSKKPKGVEVTARLAMLGVYEGKSGPTSYRNLENLIKAGWTLNALGRSDGMPSANGQILRGAIDESHQRVKAARNRRP